MEYSSWYFNKEGEQLLSTIGIALCLFSRAAWVHFDHDYTKAKKFIRKNLFEIMSFAENPIDILRKEKETKIEDKKESKGNELMEGVKFALASIAKIKGGVKY